MLNENWTHAPYHYFSFFIAIHRGQDSIIVPASLRHSTYAYFTQTSKTQSRKSPDTLQYIFDKFMYVGLSGFYLTLCITTLWDDLISRKRSKRYTIIL